MLKLNSINSIDFTFFSYFKVSSVFVETTDVAFSSFVLFSLLLVSLGLTFHSKGTTVHKVLGLLLTSIFVVFLWILQSQFLFIYIVYILAFISAVLMLFLSVVLMLPISTLTSKNILTDQKDKFSLGIISLGSENLTSFVITTGFILLVIYLLFLCNNIISYNFNNMYDDLVEYSKYYFKVSNQISLNNRFIKKVSINPKVSIFNNILSNDYKDVLGSSNVNVNTFYKKYVQFGFKMWDNTNYSYKNVRSCLILFFTAVELSLVSAFQFIFSKLNSFKNYMQLGIQIAKSNFYLPCGLFKVFCDIFVQTYLFISVTLSMVSLFVSKQIFLVHNASTLSNDSLQGLSQIKILLYGDFSLFLLFSTFVLLIALLGAAVMTRSKR